MIYVLLAFLLGCINVLSKTINFQATKHLGTANGTLVNYVVASILSLLLFLSIDRSYLQLEHFSAAPSWLYLGGVFGLIALVINIISLHKMNLFQSTIIVLIGQLIGSIVLDAFLFESMVPLKIFGISLLAVGVIWDKKIVLTTN
ncbi:MAG: DMT family transporter [Bacillaceae bacterium]